MLRVRPTERQPVPQPRQAAGLGAARRAGYGVQCVDVSVAEVEQVFVAKGREAVGPDVGQVGGGDAAAVVADADRDAGERAVRWRRGWRIEAYGVRQRRRRVRGRGDGDLDRFALLAVFDGGAEGVFEELGEDVCEVGGHVGEAGVGLAVYEDGGAHAVFQLAYLRDEGFAVADCFGGAERRVDYAD